MIYSPKHGYIFIHIPKTGGTSMALALEARAAKDDVMLGDTPKAIKRRTRVKDVAAAGRLWKHSTLFDIEGLITADQARDWFVFSLVRNPWDRMVSYYHWLQRQSFDHPAVGLAKTLDFAGFLTHPGNQAALRAETYGAYLTLPGQGEMPARFVRLEHLATDLAPIKAHLGFALSPLPQANASDRAADYRPYYSSETAALVAELYEADIARFRYDF